MSKKLLKPLILIVVFIVAVISFSVVTNKSNQDMTTTMAPATLPVMSFQYGNYEINELCGYVKEMEMTSMRSGITPIGEDRLLHMKLDTYGMEIKAIAYEIRNMDGSNLMASNEVDFTQNGKSIDAEIKVENILTVNEEYSIVFTVTTEEKSIYYYTRLMECVGGETDICLDFAVDFHNHTLDKSQDGSYFANYVDAATGDTTSFHYVDLTCTARQIMWKGFDCSQVSDIQIVLNEITENYNACTFRYVLSSVTANGEIEYYNVEEYFRLRQGNTQMYVLNYERTTEQVFRPDNNFINGSNAISLGITSPDIEYTNNDSGTIIAFVQEGALWSYDIANNTLVQVFTFRGLEGVDVRENWPEHDIKVLRVNEAGSVDFIVYGYMNRGRHEGEVGIGIYHYDGISHTVSEEAFIPAYSTYGVVDAELGRLLYQNDRGIVYLTTGGKLYQVDLNELKISVAVDHLIEGSYTSSQSSRYFAWVDSENQYKSKSLYFMDLVDGNIIEISGNEGEFIKPLGFIGEDFIYGLANESDVLVDAAGTTIFPMKTIRIVSSLNPKKDVLKEYNGKGNYISGIEVDNYIVHISLIQNNDGQYVASGNDQIMNRAADTERVVYTSAIPTEAKETQYFINFKETLGKGKLKRITPKEVLSETSTQIDMDVDEKQVRYYVHLKGRAIFSSDSISAAILMANKENAVVVDQKQNYVWQRSRSVYKDPITGLSPLDSDAGADSIAQCISALLKRANATVGVTDMIQKGYTPKEVLEMTLKDYRVLDLTGCTVDEMLYYVNRSTPVFGMTGSDSAVLITGYTSGTIFYYDPMIGSNKQISIEEANQMFYNGGNIFFSYIEQ